MKTHLYKMECITDMHVGNGETNYSIIDNEVQKDTVLQDVPIIHASGVKGALKEHFECLWGKEDIRIKNIFGDKDDAGKYKFFTAICVARPLRVSNGSLPYVLATSDAILEHFSFFLKGMGMGLLNVYDKANDPLIDGANIEVEGMSLSTKNCVHLEELIGKDFIVIGNLCDYDLPVRARNVLDDNGLSKNLWYEELVPHKSIFYFTIITPDDACELVFCENIPVQFGGNASIGNGYCTIKEVFPHE